MIDFLKDLNEAQQQAVEYIDGPSLVIAGAGSGKTRVLTYKIAYLLRCGYEPGQILALTFTNKASREMRERIDKLTNTGLSRNLVMGTFHSVFSRFLRTEAPAIGYTSSFTIYDTADSKNLVKAVIASLNLNEEFYKPNSIYSQISHCKNNLLTPEAYRSHNHLAEDDAKRRIPRFVDIYDGYCRECRKSNVMDFDDLLLQTNVLFRDHPEILAKYMNRFSFVLVDEYQDTNLSQYLIIKKLSQMHRKLCVVGDDAQSIYGFRGARIENILNFQNDYSDYKIFRLEQNYRSTQNIVNAANSLIKKNSRQISKEVFSRNDNGELIAVHKALTDTEEGIMIARMISETVHRQRLPYSEMAVLYRTNAQSRNLEEALRKWNIPYKIYGGLSFYQRKEIKDVIAYLRYIINRNDDEALKRIINYPSRKIGNTTIDRLLAAATDKEVRVWDIISNTAMCAAAGLNSGTIEKLKKFAALITELEAEVDNINAADLIELVIKKTGIHYDLMLDKTPQGVSRFENVDELINSAKDYIEEQEQLDSSGMISIVSYLENISLLTDHDTDNEEDKNKLTLMTVHAAKGLEFDVVFLAGMEEGLFPGQMAVESLQDIEEERRLFYVAITRARKQMIVTYTASRFRFGSLTYPNPSRFLSEIDGAFIEWKDKPGLRSFDEELEKYRSVGKGSDKGGVTLSAKLKPISTVMSNASKKTVADADADAELLKPEEIVPGQWVVHDRFGKGKVISTDTYGDGKTAMVFFEDSGLKKILLNFAKLKSAH